MYRQFAATAGAATALLAAALAPTPWGASHAASQPPSTLLAGHVTSHGDPAARATVKASLFPTIPDRGFTPGTVVHPLTLPPVSTADDGSFAIAAPDAQALAGYVDKWGRIDLTLVVDDGIDVTSYTESTALPAAAVVGTGKRSPFADPAPTGPANFDVDLGTGRVAETLGLPGSTTHRLDIESLASFRAARSARAPMHPCRTTLGDKHKGRTERFMYVNNWKGAPALVQQGAGTDHELGIAMKLAGKAWKSEAGHRRCRTAGSEGFRVVRMESRDIVHDRCRQGDEGVLVKQ